MDRSSLAYLYFVNYLPWRSQRTHCESGKSVFFCLRTVSGIAYFLFVLLSLQMISVCCRVSIVWMQVTTYCNIQRVCCHVTQDTIIKSPR